MEVGRERLACVRASIILDHSQVRDQTDNFDCNIILLLLYFSNMVNWISPKLRTVFLTVYLISIFQQQQKSDFQMFSEQFQIFLKISRKKWTTLIAILHSLFVGHFVFVFHVPLCLLLNSNLSLYLYLQRLAEQGAIYYLRNSHRPDDRKTLMQYQLKSENLNHPKYCLFTLANATLSFFFLIV